MWTRNSCHTRVSTWRVLWFQNLCIVFLYIADTLGGKWRRRAGSGSSSDSEAKSPEAANRSVEPTDTEDEYKDMDPDERNRMLLFAKPRPPRPVAAPASVPSTTGVVEEKIRAPSPRVTPSPRVAPSVPSSTPTSAQSNKRKSKREEVSE
jgi:hypothetical protein